MFCQPICGDSVMVTQQIFQFVDSGSTPTSPLQLRIKRISKPEATEIYKKWHYLGEQDFLSSINFGAFIDWNCYGALSFGPCSAPNMDDIYSVDNQYGFFEIKRLAMDDKCPKNSESRFIAISIKLLRKIMDVKIIITYADTSVGHKGTIYKASGFEYKGLTAKKTDFYVDGKLQTRGKTKGINGIWKPRSRKHLFIKQFI